jgi:ribosome production factor 1
VPIFSEYSYFFISYAFRSEEKVALQEIGPRFTLKLRWLKKGIPAAQNFGEPTRPLEFDNGEDEGLEESATQNVDDAEVDDGISPREDAGSISETANPPKANEYEWQWKPDLETTRRTFFL